MNGVHDMGGTHGFGPIERDEATFHADWEKRVRAMVNAVRARGLYNIDESRYGIERMPPAEYLRASYFERWLASLETNLVDKGVLREHELSERTAAFQANPAALVPRRADAALVERLPASRSTSLLVLEGPTPGFTVGEAVRTKNMHPRGHTRLPRYARGRQGVIHRVQGNPPLADAAASGLGQQPEPLYSVRFAASELWGTSADGNGSVYLDLWESYLTKGSV